MKRIKKLLGIFIMACALLFVPNNVDAANIKSVNDLKDAFQGENATVSGKIVTLTGNIENNDVFEFSEDDYILDLNGYKFIAEKFYIDGGSLNINDSNGNGELDTTSDWVRVENGANLIINNGKLDYLTNYGTTTIKNGIVDSITNDGLIIIENGSFGGILQRGNAEIKGGTFTSTSMTSIIDLDKGSTIIKGNVTFNSTTKNSALCIKSSNYIDLSVIEEITDEDYIVSHGGQWENSYETEYSGVVIRKKDEVENVLNIIAPNGIWTINGSKPKDREDAEFLLTSILGDLKLPEGYGGYAHANVGIDYNPESAIIILEYNGYRLIEKKVKAIYNEPSENVKNKVNSILDKIAAKHGEEFEVEKGFRLEDLHFINYLYANSKNYCVHPTSRCLDISLALNFTKDLIALTNGGNISYKYDSRLGEITPTGLWLYSGGRVIVYYGDVAVGTTEIGLITNHVLYVPSDTANTDEARIAAALKRIEEHLGTTEGISITVGGTLNSLNANGLTWMDYGFIDDRTSGSNYYNITIKGETYRFAICKKDADQLDTPEFLTRDISSDITIKSSSIELPLDAAISVNIVKNDEIKKAVETSVYAAYDISLYSNAKEVNIRNLENGKFIVSIPVPEILKNKEITVYYINDKGEKEEHMAVVKDGIASFETNHFSTYVLVEKGEIENPQTFDSIGNSIMIGIISLISLIVLTINSKKTNKSRV